MSSNRKAVSSKLPISDIEELLKNIPPPPEKVPYPPKLSLNVMIMQGRKLSSKGCYCTLQVGNKTVETSKENHSYDPVWNEQFHFRKVDYCDNVNIQLFDKDSNEIGTIQIPLVDLNVNEVVDKWYRIGKNEKKSNGVRLVFHLATKYDIAFHGNEIKIESDDSEKEENSREINESIKIMSSKEKDKKKYSTRKAMNSDESD